MPLVSRSSEIIHFTVIWDHISNAEQEGSDDLYHTAEYVLQYAPRNLIIAKRHLLEYLPRYVLEYVSISYDKYRRYVLRYVLGYVPISYGLIVYCTCGIMSA
jgi:hypothetical protein